MSLRLKFFNPFQDVGWLTRSPASFPPATSTSVKISLKNFQNFSFNSFSTLVETFKPIPSASSKLLNLNQGHSSKKNVVFLIKPYKNEITITSLIEMIELSEFAHMTTSLLSVKSRVDFLLVMYGQKQ